MDRTLDLNGHKYELKFGNRAIRKIEEKHDAGIEQVVNAGKMSNLLDLFHAGLQHNDDPPSQDFFDDNFSLKEDMEKCLEVLNHDMGGDLSVDEEKKKGKSKQSPSAGKKRKSK